MNRKSTAHTGVVLVLINKKRFLQMDIDYYFYGTDEKEETIYMGQMEYSLLICELIKQ